ncbi:MAG: hypothetical protein QNJ72_27120 [Pleurocapsa sp. MO_226.B13]|nr:hypothetical protein [Pleurocapsa sp. MO_226.B13]
MDDTSRLEGGKLDELSNRQQEEDVEKAVINYPTGKSHAVFPRMYKSALG